MSDVKNYYNKPEYEGLETDYRILDAIEELTDCNILDNDSDAFIWWANGGDKKKIIEYLDEKYPDWRELDRLNWGCGGITSKGDVY